MLSSGLVKIKKSEIPLIAREEIKKALTVVPSDTLEPIFLWEEDESLIGVPRGYFFDFVQKRFDPTYAFSYSLGSKELTKTNGIEFREGQKEVVEECVSHLKKKDFGGLILEAKVGSGKTPMTLEIARRMGNKTLVIVHTSVLLEQWRREVKNIMPNWSCGLVYESVCDTEGNDICIGMLQSLSLKDYSKEFYEQFGTIIIDEVDRVACDEFHKVFKKFSPQYLIGCTGTLKRTDNAESLIKHSVGKVVSAIGTVHSLDPTIYFIDTRFLWRPGSDIKNETINSEDRNELIASNAEKAAIAGRHVLILTKRVVHAEMLYRKLLNKLVKKNIKVGLMVGETDESVRSIHQSAQVLVATAQLISVGFNNPRLDTLIFASPMQETTQAIGRILRLHPDKKQPMVIDIVDSQNIPAFRAAKRRRDGYRAKGWQIKGDRFLG